MSAAQLDKLQDQAVRQTLAELEKTGSGQLTDGEQAKPSFLVYPYVYSLLIFLFIFVIQYRSIISIIVCLR